MTLYYTDTRTGEMTPIHGRVKVRRRRPSIVHTQYHRRSAHKPLNPLNDFLLSFSGFCVALAFLIAVAIRPA